MQGGGGVSESKFPVLERRAGGDLDVKTRSERILALLCPGRGTLPNVSLSLDLIENRYVADYKTDLVAELAVVLDHTLRQVQYGRSYKTIRSPRAALELVLDWVWTKHGHVANEVRPAEASIDNLSAGDRDFLLNPPLGTLKRGRGAK